MTLDGGGEDGGQAAEAAVFGQLEALGIAHERLECDPALADTAAFCAHYGIPVEASCNTIIVASKREPKQFVACLVTATTRLDVNRVVRRLMGVSKASFATAEETRALTGMLIGGVTVFGLPDDLKLYVDARVMDLEALWVGGGSRSCKLKVDPASLLRLPNVEVVEGLGFEA
jgi:prolyl-tRNA editing enzyme YbaK/EbsC (Cys-tRNA(Pro) deacylase)